MSGKIWVYAETDEGKILDVVHELLSKAAQLARQYPEPPRVEAVLPGAAVAKLAEDLARNGAESVHLLEDPRLELWSPLTYVPLIADLVVRHDPDIFLFGATALGSALGPALAARLKTGMAAHCVDLRTDGEGLLVSSVPAFGGKVVGEILCPRTRPQMASVKAGLFRREAVEPRPLEVVQADLSVLDSIDSTALRPVGVSREKPTGLPLNKADLVLCGGFGTGSPDNWELLARIAAATRGAVACTRPPVDEGWIQESCMVGTSGRSIRPKVYMGFGISGATHHICGMSDAEFVISVNTDPEAPIFDVSDVKIVADAGTILASLADELVGKNGTTPDRS